jgi:undecaprenyl-diphosphatase
MTDFEARQKLHVRTLSFALVFLVLFAVLTGVVVTGSATQFDVSAFYSLNHLSSSDLVAVVASLVTQFGYEPILALFTVLLLFADRQNAKLALEVLTAFVIADAVVLVLDGVYFRPRPYETLSNVLLPAGLGSGSSFPSGHATKAFAVAAVVALQWGRKAVPIVLISCGVALSRVIIGVHYPLDVMAAAVLGGAIGIFTVYLTEKFGITARLGVLLRKGTLPIRRKREEGTPNVV